MVELSTKISSNYVSLRGVQCSKTSILKFRSRGTVITHSFKTLKFRIVEDRIPTHEDVQNAERLLVAFRLTPKFELKRDIWTRISNAQGDFFDILYNGSARDSRLISVI